MVWFRIWETGSFFSEQKFWDSWTSFWGKRDDSKPSFYTTWTKAKPKRPSHVYRWRSATLVTRMSEMSNVDVWQLQSDRPDFASSSKRMETLSKWPPWVFVKQTLYFTLDSGIDVWWSLCRGSMPKCLSMSVHLSYLTLSKLKHRNLLVNV